MSKSEIKSKLHNLVDKINDEMLLLNFYNAFNSVAEESVTSDQLTQEKKLRLNQSLNQYKNGEIVQDTEVRKQISSWIEK